MIHVQLNINWINSCTISRFINHTFWYTLYVTSLSKSVHLGVLELVWKCAICTINVHFHTKLTAPKLTLVLGGTTYDIWSYYMWGKYLGLCCPRGRADFLWIPGSSIYLTAFCLSLTFFLTNSCYCCQCSYVFFTFH